MTETVTIKAKNPNMFELDRELVLAESPSYVYNNLSLIYFEPKFTTYATFSCQNVVHLISWDLQMENVTMESLPLKEADKDPAEPDRELAIMQSRLVIPSNRTLPVMVVATVLNVLIFDVKNLKILASTRLDDIDEDPDLPDDISAPFRYAKGITCIENFIAIGTYTGEIIMFTCTGENSFNVKVCSPQEHKHAIVDMATCISITALAVAPESAYIMTTSEDGNVKVWKLHSRKPEAYQIEYRYTDKLGDNFATGAQFVNGRGSGFALAIFEEDKLPIFIIKRHSQQVQQPAQPAQPAPK
ncbi:WD repeat-containing protein 54 [Aphelenchoides bicaudatus]|nr:WD repeat-containing protein 54 [Aphelenchoides bicaudatus]